MVRSLEEEEPRTLRVPYPWGLTCRGQNKGKSSLLLLAPHIPEPLGPQNGRSNSPLGPQDARPDDHL